MCSGVTQFPFVGYHDEKTHGNIPGVAVGLPHMVVPDRVGIPSHAGLLQRGGLHPAHDPVRIQIAPAI